MLIEHSDINYWYDANTQSYTIVDPTTNDAVFRWKGYWLYTNASGLQLVLPNAGGTAIPSLWTNAQFFNGSATFSLFDAQTAGWLQATIYGFNAASQNYYLIPEEHTIVEAWKGYWLYALKDNITLIT